MLSLKIRCNAYSGSAHPWVLELVHHKASQLCRRTWSPHHPAGEHLHMQPMAELPTIYRPTHNRVQIMKQDYQTMHSHDLQQVMSSRGSPGAGAAAAGAEAGARNGAAATAASGAPAGAAPARGLVRIAELLRTCVPTKKAGPGAGAIPEAGVGLEVDTAEHLIVRMS